MRPVALLTALLVGLTLAQDYRLAAVTLDGGGVRVHGGDLLCSFSIGQQVASGPLLGSNWRGYLGFWHPSSDDTTSMEEQYGNLRPSPRFSFSLAQNFPNPFSRRTTIRYSLARETDVDLAVLDVTGRVVRNLVRAKQKAGVYRATWDVGGVPQRRLPKGVYFCRLVAGDYTATRKMVKLE